MGNSNDHTKSPSSQTCNFLHQKCFQGNNIQTTLQTEDYVSESKKSEDSKPDFTLPPYLFVHNSDNRASKKKFQNNKKKHKKSNHDNPNYSVSYYHNSPFIPDSTRIFKDNHNNYENVKKSENLYEQHILKLYENSNTKKASKENFLEKYQIPQTSYYEEKKYAEPFPIKKHYSTRNSKSQDKIPSNLFTFEDEIASHRYYEGDKAFDHKEISKKQNYADYFNKSTEIVHSEDNPKNIFIYNPPSNSYKDNDFTKNTENYSTKSFLLPTSSPQRTTENYSTKNFLEPTHSSNVNYNVKISDNPKSDITLHYNNFGSHDESHIYNPTEFKSSNFEYTSHIIHKDESYNYNEKPYKPLTLEEPIIYKEDSLINKNNNYEEINYQPTTINFSNSDPYYQKDSLYPKDEKNLIVSANYLSKDPHENINKNLNPFITNDNNYKNSNQLVLNNPYVTLSASENFLNKDNLNFMPKETLKKKNFLPNPFIGLKPYESNQSKTENKQETPRCLFLNKGKMTPKSKDNTKFEFKPLDSSYGSDSKYNAFSKKDEILKSNDTYETKFVPIYNEKDYPLKSTTFSYETLYKPSYSTNVENEKSLYPFSYEPKNIYNNTTNKFSFDSPSYITDKDKFIINEDPIKDKSSINQNQENIVGSHENITSSLKKPSKALPPLFVHQTPLIDNLSNRNKTYDIINETYNKSDENLKKSNDKILENNVMDFLKQNPYIPSEATIINDLKDISGVRQVVSIPCKQHKILRTNTNVSINAKNWADFPYTRSVSVVGNETDSNISKEDVINDLKKPWKLEQNIHLIEKSPPITEQNEPSLIQRELSMDDLPSIFSDNNNRENPLFNEKSTSIVKPTIRYPEENQNSELSQRKSKSLNSREPNLNSLEYSPITSNHDISSQKIEKAQCEMGSQSEIQEIPENAQLLSLDDEILKIVKFEDKLLRNSCPNKKVVHSSLRDSKQLKIDFEKIDEFEENKPKSKSDFIIPPKNSKMINRKSLDELSDLSDINEKSQRLDQRNSKNQSFDETKIIIFEEANLPNFSFQADSLSEIEEDESEGKHEVKKKETGRNYFKKLKENMKRYRKIKQLHSKRKIVSEDDREENGEKQRNMDKWTDFQPSKRKNKGFYKHLFKQRKNKKINKKTKENNDNWLGFAPEVKTKKNYFKKLREQRKQSKIPNVNILNENSDFEGKEEKNGKHKKTNYFSLLKKKKIMDKNKKTKEQEQEITSKNNTNYEKWGKFTPFPKRKYKAHCKILKKTQRKFKLIKVDHAEMEEERDDKSSSACSKSKNEINQDETNEIFIENKKDLEELIEENKKADELICKTEISNEILEYEEKCLQEKNELLNQKEEAISEKHEEEEEENEPNLDNIPNCEDDSKDDSKVHQVEKKEENEPNLDNIPNCEDDSKDDSKVHQVEEIIHKSSKSVDEQEIVPEIEASEKELNDKLAHISNQRDENNAENFNLSSKSIEEEKFDSVKQTDPQQNDKIEKNDSNEFIDKKSLKSRNNKKESIIKDARKSSYFPEYVLKDESSANNSQSEIKINPHKLSNHSLKLINEEKKSIISQSSQHNRSSNEKRIIHENLDNSHKSSKKSKNSSENSRESSIENDNKKSDISKKLSKNENIEEFSKIKKNSLRKSHYSVTDDHSEKSNKSEIHLIKEDTNNLTKDKDLNDDDDDFMIVIKKDVIEPEKISFENSESGIKTNERLSRDCISPIKPKFANINIQKNENNDKYDKKTIKLLEEKDLTEFETPEKLTNNQQFSPEKTSATPIKNKKYQRLGKYAEIALNLEQLLSGKNAAPEPKIDKYHKLGKYAEVANTLEKLFSGRKSKDLNIEKIQKNQDLPFSDRKNSKRMSFEDFLKQKSLEIEKKESPKAMYHVQLESPVNLPKNRKKAKAKLYEFEI